MANEQLRRILLRGDPEAEWLANDPVLARHPNGASEVGVVTDTNPPEFVVGDNATPFSQLPRLKIGGVTELDQLSDVSSPAPANTNRLGFNGDTGLWEPVVNSLANITDVNPSGVADGHELYYDGASGVWLTRPPPSAPSGQSDLKLISVEDPEFGASPYWIDNTSQHVKVQAALDAAGQEALDAVVYFPRLYYCDQKPNIPANVTLRGNGNRYSGLWCRVDLGSNVPYLDFAGWSGQPKTPVLEGMLIRGPGGGSKGVAGNATDGINIGGNQQLRDVWAESFRAGLVQKYDHNLLFNVRTHQNYYSLLVPADQQTGGDHVFLSCDLGHAWYAAVAVRSESVLNDSAFFGGDVGFGPYGFVHLGDSATNGKAFLHRISTYDLSFEGIGNAAIADLVTGTPVYPSLHYCTFRNVGFLWTAANELAGEPQGQNYAVYLRKSDHSKIIPGSFTFTSGDLGDYFVNQGTLYIEDPRALTNPGGAGNKVQYGPSSSVIQSPDGTWWRVNVDNTGALSTTAI